MRAATIPVLLALFAAIGTGCKNSHTLELGDAVRLDELTPTAKLPDRAVLNLSQTEIPVDVVTESDGNLFRITLKAYGEQIEAEKYEMASSRFSLVECLDETYSPPMPLLFQEMKASTPWKWKGKIVSTGGNHDADAEIFIVSEPNAASAKGALAWKVQANLNLNAGAQLSAKRVLTFLFVPKKGLVAREFGMGSTRTLELAKPADEVD